MLPYSYTGGFMNSEQHRLLFKMKNLIKKGNYRFINRKDRDYKKN